MNRVLTKTQVASILQDLHCKPKPGGDNGGGFIWEKPSGHNPRLMHIPYPLSAGLLRDILKAEGFVLSPQDWNHLLRRARA